MSVSPSASRTLFLSGLALAVVGISALVVTAMGDPKPTTATESSGASTESIVSAAEKPSSSTDVTNSTSRPDSTSQAPDQAASPPPSTDAVPLCTGTTVTVYFVRDQNKSGAREKNIYDSEGGKCLLKVPATYQYFLKCDQALEFAGNSGALVYELTEKGEVSFVPSSSCTADVAAASGPESTESTEEATTTASSGATSSDLPSALVILDDTEACKRLEIVLLVGGKDPHTMNISGCSLTITGTIWGQSAQTATETAACEDFKAVVQKGGPLKKQGAHVVRVADGNAFQTPWCDTQPK